MWQQAAQRMRTTLCWLLIILLAVPASAARRSPREAATQTADGASVALVLVTGERVKGRLFGVTREGVTIVSGRDSLQSRAVPFAEIKSFKATTGLFTKVLVALGIAWAALLSLVIMNATAG
jgi:hypothetical protein